MRLTGLVIMAFVLVQLRWGMVATLVVKILANYASFLPKPQIPLEPEIFMSRSAAEKV